MTFTLKNFDNNISHLVFDLEDSSVNLLSSTVLYELEQMMEVLEKNDQIKVLFLVSAKKDVFIAGADISEIKALEDEDKAYDIVRRGQGIVRAFSQLPFTTVAVIDGVCLGGGLELALNCDFRIATQNPKTKIGLPEVSLGVLPGFSGSIMLKQLTGIAKAIELILGSKQLTSDKALKLGVVDVSVPAGYLDFKLDSFAQEIQDKKFQTKLINSRHKNTFVEKYLPSLVWKFSRKEVLKKTKGKYPAPLAVIDLFEATHNLPNNEALEMEARTFAKLSIGDISKNLISLFYASEELKHESGVSKKVAIKEFNTSAVVGGGVMGAGILWLFAKIDMLVRLKIRNIDQVASILKTVQKSFDALRRRRRLNSREIDQKMLHISYTDEFNGFSNCDIVLEAVVENVEAKQELYATLEQNMKGDAIIASNTSSLSITLLAQKMAHPERFIGMHFFNPVPLMPLVEVIAGEKTSDETIASVVALAKRAGKTPVVVKDCAGFLVNRILLPYINESAKILEEGSNIKYIDDTILEFGMPMGPFTLADEVGLDVGFKVAKILEEAYGSRMEVSHLLDTTYRQLNLLGKKAGRGFYVHSQDGKKMANSDVVELVKHESSFEPSEIVDRAIMIMVNEAAMCLSEGVVKNAAQLDMAMIMGTGFPPYRGGLLRYADSLGLDSVKMKLEQLSERYGERFKPAQLICDLSEKQSTFYKG